MGGGRGLLYFPRKPLVTLGDKAAGFDGPLAIPTVKVRHGPLMSGEAPRKQTAQNSHILKDPGQSGYGQTCPFGGSADLDGYSLGSAAGGVELIWGP